MSMFRRITALLRDRQGSTTVEFAMWLPIFFMIFGVATDAALLMHKQTQMIDLVRTASRQVSLGMSNEQAAEAFVMGHFDVGTAGAATVRVEGGFVTAGQQRDQIADLLWRPVPPACHSRPTRGPP
ncbi:TadE/TadG family type IV pilus assembly protein [Henriciella sp.]|uniref:TadE/TadG family type IV pilus assembly protein n=1 Tax=Henriciella sp. TaxID=1968823 RepID=UPI000C0F71E2|nr:TadE family protein [Henriciella sp.]PHR71216.1 MAG: hypothetical protein COA64_15540 [Henriciella sp.]